MTDNAAMRTALKAVLTMGSVDVAPSVTDGRHITYMERIHGVKLNWVRLTLSMSAAMREYESHGCMIWEINIDKFVEEYLKLEEGE